MDTSVVLAVFFEETAAQWAAEKLAQNATALRMSTVNLTECLIRMRSLQPELAEDLADRLLHSGIRFVAPDESQARLAAEARLRYPLNLGDCFAYALAVAEECAILTLDRDFRAADVEIVLPTSDPAPPS